MKTGKAIGNSIIYLLGAAVTALMGLLSSVVLTRLLPEQTYAMYGLFVTFSTMLVSLLSLGLDSSYARFFYEQADGRIKYFMKTIGCTIPLAIAVSIIVIEPNHFLLRLVFGENLGFATAIVMVAYVLVALLQRFMQATVRMEERAVNFVIANLVAKAGFIAIAIAIVSLFGDSTIFGIVVSFLISILTAAVINLFVFISIPDKASEESCESSVVTTREMFRYGLPFAVSNVSVLFIPLVERVLIRQFGGWEVLGIYTAASIFVTVALILQNTVDNIWNPVVYKHYSNEGFFKPILHSFGYVVTLAIIALLAVVIAFRRWLVLLFDSAYFASMEIAPILFFASAFSVISIIYSIGINISKNTMHVLISSAVQGVLSVILCLTLVPSLGVAGAGIAPALAIIASRLYRIVVGLRKYDTGRTEFSVALIWGLGFLASMVAVFSTDLISDLVSAVLLLLLSAIASRKELLELAPAVKAVLPKNAG